MRQDFYVADQRSLAARFEMEWFDHVLAQYSRGRVFTAGAETASLPGGPSLTASPGEQAIDTHPAVSALFEFPPFDLRLLQSQSYAQVADLVRQALTPGDTAPTRLLEVGPGLGRGFFEICRQTPTLRMATLVEPSRVMADVLRHLLKGGAPCTYPVLSGNAHLAEVTFDARSVREVVGQVVITILNVPHEELPPEPIGTFDIVTCFNVLDQCREPLALVERLQRHTAPGGVLALSCSCMWSSKNVGTGELPTREVKDLFDQGWRLMTETNVPFAFRVFERHWLTFLSQVLVLCKSQ